MSTKIIICFSVVISVCSATAVFGQGNSSQTGTTQINQTTIQSGGSGIFTSPSIQQNAESTFPGMERPSAFPGMEPFSSQGSRTSSSRNRTSSGSSSSRTGTTSRATTSRSNVSRNTANRNTNAMRTNMMGGMGGMGGYGSSGSNVIRSLTSLGFETEKGRQTGSASSGNPEANSVRLPKLEARINNGGLRITPIIPVTVELSGSTATLRGAVKTEHDRKLLEQFIMLEPSVLKVNNELSYFENTGPK